MATRPWDAGALFRGARLAVRASALMAVADDDECGTDARVQWRPWDYLLLPR
jgi:hypothetical protein